MHPLAHALIIVDVGHLHPPRLHIRTAAADLLLKCSWCCCFLFCEKNKGHESPEGESHAIGGAPVEMPCLKLKTCGVKI